MLTHAPSAAPEVPSPARTGALLDSAIHALTIEIGGLPLLLRTTDPDFCALLAARYSNFLHPESAPTLEFDLISAAPGPVPAEKNLEVCCDHGRWLLARGDFRASFDLRVRRGHLACVPNPYSVDTLLRVVHSLILAPAGGLLLHASGGIREGRGYIFSGVSGAGKTTMARLAPPDVRLLTDEISYVRRSGDGFRVFGTPFSGELGIQGDDVSAPLAAIYLIEHGPANRLAPVAGPEAARRLMRNTLFFARDPGMVADVFSTVCELVRRVPVFRLEFLPDPRVWKLIG
jgi:hypothetical protein